MKSTIIATVLATGFVIIMAIIQSPGSRKSTPKATFTAIPTAPRQAAEEPPELPEPPVTVAMTEEEREAYFAEVVTSKVTAEHQLYLDAEQQRLYQINLAKALEAEHVYQTTGSERAKADWSRYAAEVERLDKLVVDSQQAD